MTGPLYLRRKCLEMSFQPVDVKKSREAVKLTRRRLKFFVNRESLEFDFQLENARIRLFVFGFHPEHALF